MTTQYVYFFGGGKADGHKGMKDTLGGKGAGLAEMTNASLPVPPGFTISTAACNLFQEKKGALPPEIDAEIDRALGRLETLMGKKLGDASDPLLVSVRSGAKFSMPGMMDTILNLGLNDRSVEGLKAKTRNGRFAADSYRRFIQMFGNVVLGIDKDRFEHELSAVKQKNKVKADVDLTEDALRDVIARFKKVVKAETGREFPQEPKAQLYGARDAVFESWMNPRAITYRKLNDIPHDLGTAVNVQTMVFGNMGETSATGVGFTRNPSTGAKEFYGEFLQNAQGEDVVAGIRTPQPIAQLEKVMPEAYRQLREITTRLEKHYKDVQDFEFTIQENTLFMLQTRNGKRTGLAAVHTAVDMVDEGIITKQEAVGRVEPQSLDQLLHPIFDPKERGKAEVAAKGLPASPGAATGAIVFTADDAVAWSQKGKRVLLVRMETVPDDIHGMSVAQGILTATGGMTSHAAVVGRQMGKPSVVGCGALEIDGKAKRLKVGGKVLKEGDPLSIDGTTGEVILKELATSPSEVLQVVGGKKKPAQSVLYQKFEKLLSWADEVRRLGVRANADIPRDAKIAFAFGARGIGLCRTEHMFFAEDRLALVVKMILSAARGQRGLDVTRSLQGRIKESRGAQAAVLKKELAAARKEYGKSIDDYLGALKKLQPMQRSDFAGLFKEMHGHPVTIRTLDPPLHEFLPKREELMVQVATLKAKGEKKNQAAITRASNLLRAVEELHEFNPMLGHRGCRLGVTYPEITRMQARAIFEAAKQVAKSGTPVKPEVMIPLVGHVEELRRQKKIVQEAADEVLGKDGSGVQYLIGTMIEVPRGALTADEIAKEAQFFSFGTNDLTQMGFGLSRDDAGRFLLHYLEHGLLDKDPFVSLDASGVGQLVEIGVKKGRGARPGLKIGICGEHGGDPASIRFFHDTGLDYVSCSPYRVPIARLAAAQAQLEKPVGD
ncbi:MAG TPA: pyruvate, phosphate dikinase [Vicinamibacteria bacterium]|nr:pyruvate, phosphate dikinase [Vicinamibacteria bacterium]